MPWFVPKVFLPEATSEWINRGGPGQKHKIGRWPHPNTNRTKSGFIMETDRDLAHTAFKRLFCYNMSFTSDPVNFPLWQNFGWMDLDVVANSHVDGDSGINVEGWELHEDIQSFAVLPVLGTPGVELKMHLSHAASGHFNTRTYEFDGLLNAWYWDRDGDPLAGPPSSEVSSVDMPYEFLASFEWAMSDCFLFPRAEAGPLDWASFNNLDKYIQFDQYTNFTNFRHQCEFDIRFRDTDQCAVLCRQFNTTRWLAVTPNHIQWMSILVNFSATLNLNQWYTIRIEFEWNDPGTKWKLYVDGVLDGTNTVNGTIQLIFNRIGKKGPTFEGDFDLKNLTLLDTDPASPRVLLDMELQVNACDVGEKSIKGTTFVMTLPSCP